MKNTHTQLVAVYGALRKKCNSHYLLNGTDYVGSFDSEPIYDMYSNIKYPLLVKNGNTSIKIEVYELDDQEYDIIKRVSNIESTNVTPMNFEEIDTPYGKALIHFSDEKVTNKIKIESGDWFQHKTYNITPENIKQLKHGME